MEYRLRPDRPLGEEARKIARSQIDAAIGELSSPRNSGRSVHEARKCLKRVRSLVCLLRPALGEKTFKREDRRIRTIARMLSSARDCQAMIETVGRIELEDGRVWDAAAAQSLKSQLHRDRDKAEFKLMRHGLQEAIDGLGSMREHYRTLNLKIAARHVAKGLGETYRRGREDFQISFKKNRHEDFHSWRKSAQQHWRQMQLFWHAWPAVLEARTELACELSQLLGHDHDLSVLMNHVRQKTGRGATRDNKVLFDSCKRRQKLMRASARLLGERLFAERPRDFRNRMNAYWRAARRRDASIKDAAADGRPMHPTNSGSDEHSTDLTR